MAKYPPPNPPFIGAKHRGGSQTPTLIVIHSTVGPTKKGSARSIGNYFKRGTVVSSAHYGIDAAEVIQYVGDHTVAYHCGYNQNSVGLEMCDYPSSTSSARWKDADHKAMLSRTAKLTAELGAAYGIPMRFLSDAKLREWGKNKIAKNGGIVTHDQMSRVFKKSSHWDPGKWPAATFLLKAKAARAALAIKPTPKPESKPVTSHARWAVRVTGVHETKGGKKLRDLKVGESFKVIDGSGHGNDGWIETTHHNWVLGKDTSTTAPDAPAGKARLSIMTHNVWNGRNWTKDVLPTLNGILEDHKPDVPCLQECYKAPDLVGKVPGYAYRYQGHGYPPKTEGYVEERADNLILVRDGVSVKATEAYEMTKSWAGPKAGVMHDPRVFRRVTVNKDGQNFRVVNVHGPFTAAARKEFLTWARAEFEKLAALGDPVVFIGDWNFKYAELVEAMGPLATVDGAAPDMAVYANCRKTGSKNLGLQGSDTHDCKIFEFEAS
jgi:N-acetylmuramoyl-L-alanine amidase CwlA/endonuclease/exonuclease/phosphatase family metal-dependent hydrolase